MQRIIYKYAIGQGRTTLSLPEGSTIRSVGVQDGDKIVVWVEQDYEKTHAKDKSEQYEFLERPTGQLFELAVNHRFLGTFVFTDPDDYYVGHVYYRKMDH